MVNFCVAKLEGGTQLFVKGLFNSLCELAEDIKIDICFLAGVLAHSEGFSLRTYHGTPCRREILSAPMPTDKR